MPPKQYFLTHYNLTSKKKEETKGNEEKVQYSFVCVFLSEVAKGTREVTQKAQFILNGLSCSSTIKCQLLSRFTSLYKLFSDPLQTSL